MVLLSWDWWWVKGWRRI